MAVCAVNCMVATAVVVRMQQSAPDSQIFVKNRNFCLPHLHLMPPLGGPHRNIAMTSGTEKLE